MKCRECDGEITSKKDRGLCQSCRFDRVLNDLIILSPKFVALVALEALAYSDVISHMKVRMNQNG